MNGYNINDRVIVLGNRVVYGTITNLETFGPLTLASIMTDGGKLITEPLDNITHFSPIESPIDLFERAIFQNSIMFSVASTMHKLQDSNRDSISTLKSSKTLFKPYQFKPLIKFIQSESRKILIADEVGLGKTIEAGHILMEMTLRDQVKNCLIVCKKSLKEKWQTEMIQKFGFDFSIYRTKDLIEAINTDHSTGSKTVMAIVNYEKAVNDNFISTIENLPYEFDMIIIDEAQHLRNSETQRHKELKKIIDHSSFVLMLTATPVMTHIDNLYNLVRLIEPRYEEYGLFMDHLALSKPFIEAINRLNGGDNPSDIFRGLKESVIDMKLSLKDGSFYSYSNVSVSEQFKTDPLFLEGEALSAKFPFTNKDFARLQFLFSELNSFHQILSRTRKREVQTASERVIRNVETRDVLLSGEELEIYNEVISEFDDIPLVLVTRKRQASSCLPSFMKDHGYSEDILETVRIKDAKYSEFRKIIEDVVIKNNKKLITFSFFKSTLKYLQSRLREIRIDSAILDGDVDNRQAIIDSFRDNSQIKILLSSEVGSEGLDLQFCDALINYDLPWNPMVVEQRIGRIDRIGQLSPYIYIYNLCISGSIEEQIYERLLTRINVFRESIGDLEDILSSEESVFEIIENLEGKFYGQKLSSSEQRKLLETAEKAIEHAELMKKQIETELADSFVSDIYFNDKIDQITRQGRYVSADDLKIFIRMLIQDKVTSLRADFECDNPFLEWNSDDKTLFEFIETYLPNKYEYPIVYKRYISFKKKYYQKDRIACTFDQQEAFNSKSLEYITAYHPFVQAGLRYYKKIRFDYNKAFCFQIFKENIPEGGPKAGFYLLAKYRIELVKYSMNKEQGAPSHVEMPLLFSLQSKEMPLVDKMSTNLLMECSSNYWKNHPQPLSAKVTQEIIEPMKRRLMKESFSMRIEIENEERNLFMSRQNRLLTTESGFIKRQLIKQEADLQKNLDNPIRPIIEKRIKDMTGKLKLIESQIGSFDLQAREILQSLSILEIK